MNDAISAMRKFLAAIDGMGIEYFVGGSICSIVYGFARTTRDVDIVVTLKAKQAFDVWRGLQSDFYADEVAIRRAIQEGDCFNALDLESMFQLDVFTPKPSEWVTEQFGRRRSHTFSLSGGGIEVFIASPEDIVLNKLAWFRLGNEASRVQWDDAVGVLVVQKGRLDEAYMRLWAQRLDLAPLLERAIAAGG